MVTEACAGGGLQKVGVVSMGQIHLLVLCKQAVAEFVSEVETGSVPADQRPSACKPHSQHQPATPLAAPVCNPTRSTSLQPHS